MWRSTSESKPVHSRYSRLLLAPPPRLSRAWRTAKPIQIISAVSNWFRRRTSHELNSLSRSIDRRKLMESYKSARASLQATLSPLDFARHVCSTIESKASKYKEWKIAFHLSSMRSSITWKRNMGYHNFLTWVTMISSSIIPIAFWLRLRKKF